MQISQRISVNGPFPGMPFVDAPKGLKSHDVNSWGMPCQVTCGSTSFLLHTNRTQYLGDSGFLSLCLCPSHSHAPVPQTHCSKDWVLFLPLIVLMVYYSTLIFYCYHCYHCPIVLILSPTIVTPFYCSTCMVLLYPLKGNVWLYWYHCPVHCSCGTMG